MSGTCSVYHPMLDNLTAHLAKIVKHIRGEARLTEANIQDALREVRIALLEADVALPVVKQFIASVRASALDIYGRRRRKYWRSAIDSGATSTNFTIAEESRYVSRSTLIGAQPSQDRGRRLLAW